MATIVPAFKDGFSAVRSNPGLLFAGSLVAIGYQIRSVSTAVESPVASMGASIVWLLVFPFVLGGFLGTAGSAIRNTTPSVSQFVSAGRANYMRLLLGTVLFALIVVGTMIGVSILSFAASLGFLAVGALNGTIAFVLMVGATLAWLCAILAMIMFVQFYDAAIVIEDEHVFDAFGRSIDLVRTNLRSVLGFSFVWVVVFNAFLLPEYVFQLTMSDVGSADAVPIDAVPIDVGIPAFVLVPAAVVLSTIGFTYLYTVYTAYYIRMIDKSSTTASSAQRNTRSDSSSTPT